MSIYLGRSGQNLTIKPISGPNEREDKVKIMGLKCPKYPIYRGNSFLYHEIELINLPLIYQTWAENEILIDLKAQSWIDTYKYNQIPIKDLPRSPLTVMPLDSWGYELKDYQIEFAEIDHKKEHLGLFLATGSGKLLCMLLRALNMGCQRLLVFSTIGNFDDWERDSWEIFGLECVRFSNAKDKKNPIDLKSAPITLTNYEQAKFLKAKIEDGMYDGIIFDEADEFANPTKKTYRELQLIKNKLKSRKCTLACTATPTESDTDLERLWGLLSLVDKFAAGKKDDFLNKYREPVAYKELPTGREDESTFKKAIKFKTRNKEDLQRTLDTMVYRHDTSYAFNFKQTSDIIQVDMTDKQWSRYEEVLEEAAELTLAGQPNLHKWNELFGITELIYEDGKVYSGKFDVICDRLRRTDQKTILWSAFVEPTELYYEEFKDSSVIINGKKSNDWKELAKLAFQGASNIKEEEKFYRLADKFKDFPFKKPGECNRLIQTTSTRGGRGSNYSKAVNQIYSSVNVSGKATKQSMGRNKRANTKHNIFYYFYAVQGSIDLKYISRVHDKMRAMDSILTGAESLSMSGRDLLALARQKEELGIEKEDILSL